MRIAVLEDDRSQAFVLRKCLMTAGHNAISFARGISLLESMKQQKFDALLLDWNVPELSGVDVLTVVRNDMASNIPAVVVTARNAEADIVHALKQGADDYICKPIRPKELIARLETVAKRGDEPAEDDMIEIDRLRLDVSGRQALLNNVLIRLSVKDFDLAVYFMKNIGRVLSRRKIVEAVWGSNFDLTSRTLDTHVSRVRTKLWLTQENNWHLEAIYGHGYRLERLK
jgi:two-component system response regulator RegX3